MTCSDVIPRDNLRAYSEYESERLSISAESQTECKLLGLPNQVTLKSLRPGHRRLRHEAVDGDRQ